MSSAHSAKRTETSVTRSPEREPAVLSPSGAGPIENVGQGERVISGIIGGLLLHALSPRSMVSAFAFIVGGGLLYRAFTGHCPIYQMFDESTERKKTRSSL